MQATRSSGQLLRRKKRRRRRKLTSERTSDSQQEVRLLARQFESNQFNCRKSTDRKMRASTAADSSRRPPFWSLILGSLALVLLAVGGHCQLAPMELQQQEYQTGVLQDSAHVAPNASSRSLRIRDTNPKLRPIDTTRKVATSGRRIELKCPFANELLMANGEHEANSATRPTGDSADIRPVRQKQQQQPAPLKSLSSPSSANDKQHLIVWLKNGVLVDHLNPRIRINLLNGSLVIVNAQTRTDEADYDCALVNASTKATLEQREQERRAQAVPAEESSELVELISELALNQKLHRFKLKLLVAPRLAPFEFPSDAQVGMKVMVTCSALEGHQPISFVWLKDNQIIQTNADAAGGSSGGGGGGSSARFIGGMDELSRVRRESELSETPALILNALNQRHQQQLTDKYALAPQGGEYLGDVAQKSEYVLVGEQLAADDGRRKNSGGGDSMPPLVSSVLSDSSIKIKQFDDYSILSIDQLDLKHSGRYTCSAQNEGARVSQSSQLAINAPPKFTLEPQDGDLVSGQSIWLDCAASGQPRPQISWLKARANSNHNTKQQLHQQQHWRLATTNWDFVPIYDSLRYSVLANGSLHITNVTKHEQGFYLCSAKNGFAPDLSKLIKIIVHEPARVATRYKLLEVKVDTRAELSCHAFGEQPIELQWLDKDNKLIAGAQASGPESRFIVDDSLASSNTNDTNNRQAADQMITNGPAHGADELPSETRLIITKTMRQHSAHYSCQAQNKFGADKMVYNLVVQEVPDKVLDLKVTNVSSATISLRWQLAFTGNSPVIKYFVQYQSDDPLDELLMSSAGFPGGASNDSSGQHLAAASSASDDNQHENSILSALMNVATSLVAKSSQAEPEQQQQQQQRQQLHQLHQPQSQTAEGQSSAAITSAIDEAIDRTLMELTVEQTATSLAIKDLLPSCVYRLRLAAINRIGLGELSDWIRVKTEEAPPSGSALKMSASATGPNSIKLSWFPPDRRQWNGQLTHFNIGYRPIDSNYELNKTAEFVAPSLQSIVRQLQRQNNHDSQAYHQLISSFKKSAAATSSSSSQKNQSADTSGGSSSSSSTNNAANIIKQNLRNLIAAQQEPLTAHLTNLQRSTTYLVWIQAVNSRGAGPQSHAITVKTLDDVPPSAPAVRLQSATSNSITLAWSILSNFVSSANKFSLYYRRVYQNPSAASSLFTDYHSSHHDIVSPLNQSSAAQVLGHRQSSSALPANSKPTATSSGIAAEPFNERIINNQQLLTFGSTGPSPFGYTEASRMSAGGHQSDSMARQLMDTSAGGPSNQQQQQHYQHFVYTLDQLDCGTFYEIYMITHNSVGKSEPSESITTKTVGEPPIAPSNKNSLFSHIGSQEVLLNLASWSTGGCPLTSLIVRHKQLGPSSASANLSAGPLPVASPSSWPPAESKVSTNLLSSINDPHRPRAISTGQFLSEVQRHLSAAGKLGSASSIDSVSYAVKQLQSSTGYELKLIAANSAGYSVAEYEFTTAAANGTRNGFARREFHHRRVDQKGQLLTDSAYDSNPSQSPRPSISADDDDDDEHQPHPQQPMVDTQISPTAMTHQLVPVVLIFLCIVCLVISSTFCFYRLADSWKQHRSSIGLQRDSPDEDEEPHHHTQRHPFRRHQQYSATVGRLRPDSNGDLNCPIGAHHHHHHHHQSIGSGGQLVRDSVSPSSTITSGMATNYSQANKMTLLNDTNVLWRQQAQSSGTMLKQTTNWQTGQMMNSSGVTGTLRLAGQHSSQNQRMHLMSATLKPKSSSFAQSVSMRDFNDLMAPKFSTIKTTSCKTDAGGQQQQQQQQSTSLIEGPDPTAATMDNNTYSHQPPAPNGICAQYGTLVGANKMRTFRVAADSSIYTDEGNQQQQTCYPIEEQQVESNWSNVGQSSEANAEVARGTATTYAIPSFYQVPAAPPPIADPNVDACIQQLVRQQSNANQNNQTYAYLMNPNKQDNQTSAGRCIHDANNFSICQQPESDQTNQLIPNHCMSGGANFSGGQSAIDSSSSSSGIGVDSASSGGGHMNSSSSHIGSNSHLLLHHDCNQNAPFASLNLYNQPAHDNHLVQFANGAAAAADQLNGQLNHDTASGQFNLVKDQMCQ